MLWGRGEGGSGVHLDAQLRQTICCCLATAVLGRLCGPAPGMHVFVLLLLLLLGLTLS